jgi:hypothetical protein
MGHQQTVEDTQYSDVMEQQHRKSSRTATLSNSLPDTSRMVFASSIQRLIPPPPVIDFTSRSYIAPHTKRARALITGKSTAGACSEGHRPIVSEGLADVGSGNSGHKNFSKTSRRQDAPKSYLSEAMRNNEELIVDHRCLPHFEAPENWETNTKPDVPLSSGRVRQCTSCRELKTLAPPSGSSYEQLMTHKELLEITHRNRLHSLRNIGQDTGGIETITSSSTTEGSIHSSRTREVVEESSTSTSSTQHKFVEGTYQSRNQRRTAHNQASTFV